MSMIALNLDLADAIVLERALSSTLSRNDGTGETLDADRTGLDRVALAYIQTELVRMIHFSHRAPFESDRYGADIGIGCADMKPIRRLQCEQSQQSPQ